MGRDYFDPTPEEQVVVLVESKALRRAERMIESCEHCNPGGAEIPFENVLYRVMGADPTVTDYLLEIPAICPYFGREILEKTLIEPS
jgi:hypothetical protein